MQPTLRQVPPKYWRGMQGPFFAGGAARMAATYPPGPAPITMRSYWVSLVNSLIRLTDISRPHSAGRDVVVAAPTPIAPALRHVDRCLYHKAVSPVPGSAVRRKRD